MLHSESLAWGVPKRSGIRNLKQASTISNQPIHFLFAVHASDHSARIKSQMILLRVTSVACGESANRIETSRYSADVIKLALESHKQMLLVHNRTPSHPVAALNHAKGAYQTLGAALDGSCVNIAIRK